MNPFFSFLAEAVSPWHAAQTLARRLTTEGYTELEEEASWLLVPGGRYFVRRGGSALAAFTVGSDPAAGWSVAVAHTDSPGWRLKVAQQKPHANGVVRIGTEVYGAPIYSTWFDRPLSIAGRVFVKGPEGPRSILVHTDPVGLFPNLAIHYNKEVNKGAVYDLGEHLSLLAALDAPDLQTFLGRKYGFAPDDWLSADLFAVLADAPRALGDHLFVSPRIDNLAGCHAVIEGLIASKPGAKGHLALCFDQEEIGSSTWTGADSSLLGDLIARIHTLTGGTAEDLFRAKAKSFILSVDAAHAVHPNWSAMHDEGYAPVFGRGPVLKASARFSYSTTGASDARVRSAAQKAGVGLQTYVMKSTLTPGGTVGPMATSWTGMAGADVGIPIWAMHSVAETADQRDQEAMVALVTCLFD